MIAHSKPQYTQATAAQPRQLCMCVDDYGLHQGVNQAVLSLAATGRIQATSCMVGAPQFKPGAAALREMRSAQFEVGLHLDLTEHPLHMPAFKSLPGLIMQSATRQLNKAALRAEIKAQLDAFEQSMGCAPDYIDGHQHVHQFAQVRDELLEQLALRAYPIKPWIRQTRSGLKRRIIHQLSNAQARKAIIIQSLGAAQLSVLARRGGFAQNRRLLGVYDFAGGAAVFQSNLNTWFEAAHSGDVLMCHPSALGTDTTFAIDTLLSARTAEFEVLSSAAFPDLLARHNIQLNSLRSVLSSNP